MKLFMFITLCAIFDVNESYKILGIFPVPTRSHNILVTKLFREIAKRGHEVTYFTPYAGTTQVENLTEIPIESIQAVLPAGHKTNLWYQLEDATPFEKFKFLTKFGLDSSEILLQSEEMQNLLKSEEKFDAVLVYHFLTDALLGVAHHFQVPTIIFSSVPLFSSESFHLSQPSPPSYVPNVLDEYAGHMNFWQRLRHTFYDSLIIWYHLWWVLPKQRQLVFDYIPGKPDLHKFLNNASLILLNTHASTFEPLPQVPNVVEIGGFHIEEPKQLPNDLQTFLDESNNGVVVFSMGSILRSSDFPESKRNAILSVFSKLKENVLWKWEDENLPNQPKNLKIIKWMPLADVLAHKNVKVFINHGGLLSMMETVYHGVPLIGIPIFGDQKMNMAIAEFYKYAVVIPYKKLSEETLANALHQVLNDPKYRNNMQTRSRIMRDRQVKPMENALYWIEYVIRHQGAEHLRYPGIDLAWYQRNLLDVIAFVVFLIVLFVGLLLISTKLILRQLNKSVEKRKKYN